MSHKKIETLRHLWDDGLTAGESARRLGLEESTVAAWFDRFERDERRAH